MYDIGYYNEIYFNKEQKLNDKTLDVLIKEGVLIFVLLGILLVLFTVELWKFFLLDEKFFYIICYIYYV